MTSTIITTGPLGPPTTSLATLHPPNIRKYRYPYAQKSEIKHMVEEMLEAGIIRPSQSSYSAPVVMVFKMLEIWK